MENKWKRGYPIISLQGALEKARQVYEKEYTHPAPREVMANAMGYNGINGASSKILSALGQYGLIEPTGEDLYRVSLDSLNYMLHQKGEPERAESIKKLAFNPPLFAELREKFPDTVPSDENLKAFLVKNSYHPNSVKDIIKAYRETVDFFESETLGFGRAKAEPTNESISKSDESTDRQKSPSVNDASYGNLTEENPPLIFKISKNSNVRIFFSGSVTQESISKLISLLDISKDTFPTEEELSKENINSNSAANL